MTYEQLPATLDGRRPCRNHGRCRRQVLPDYTVCRRCLGEALTAAFGGHVPERGHVVRLSEGMAELQTAGRRGR